MSGTTMAARMSPADSILWRIERDPILRSTVTAVSLLDRVPDWDRFRSRMLEASERIPRMRHVVVEPPLGLGSPYWAVDENFDLDYHLRRIQLPQPTSFGDVLDFAAREAMSGFDHARPLWVFTIVEQVGEGAVLVQKFHHAATDGLGGIRLALEILDTTRRVSHRVHRLEQLVTPAPRTRRVPGPLGRVAEVTLATARDLTAQATRVPITVVEGAARLGRAPLRSVEAAADSLRWGARLLAPVTTPLSSVMIGRSIGLSFGAFDVDLGRLHEAGRQAGGTLNDAFITAVGAGLRRYHEKQGKPVERLRMTLPISIRREGDPVMVNRFVPVRFTVPLVPADPALRIPAIARLVREWRDGPALGLSDALANLLNSLPTRAVTDVFASILRNVDFVATNVPGLPTPSYLAGAELVRQYAFAPPSGSAVNVSLLSHVGHCCIGVNMDPAAVADPEGLVSSLEEGFEEVLSIAGPNEGTRPDVSEAGTG